MRMLLCAVAATLAGVMAPSAGDEAARYTVFAELRAPYESNRASLQRMLKREGYEAHAEGEREVAVVLTRAQLKALFDASVVYRKVAASSRPGMIEQPFLEGATIPPRLARHIRRVYFDPQRS